MSFMWLVAWLLKRRPKVRMFREWNDWGIALAVSLAIDLLGGMGRTAGRRPFKELPMRRRAANRQEGAELEKATIQ